MLKTCLSAAIILIVTTTVHAENLSGMYQGYQQGQMQQMEIQRLQLWVVGQFEIPALLALSKARAILHPWPPSALNAPATRYPSPSS